MIIHEKEFIITGIYNSDQSNDVQLKLFKLGYEWYGSGQTLLTAEDTGGVCFLREKCGSLGYASLSFFSTDPEYKDTPKITLDEFIQEYYQEAPTLILK